MASLVTVAQVRARINFESITDIDAVLASIIANVTSDLEADLRTTFTKSVGKTDVWYVQDALSRGPSFYQSYLSCSQGMVTSLTGLVAATTRLKLQSDTTDILQYATLPGGGERGVILLSDVDVSSSYIQATYTAGLDESGGAFTNAPTWLQELAINYSILKLDSVHPTVRFADGTAVTVERLGNLINESLAQHVRYEPLAKKPI